ncbi:uncharacterized protein LOC122063348 [Macadamia integrifolia]|uniref:uncharacterized protein LOC122063348 n=1 Tax=Macadamia integrifolia TaxID=60698 RepID=UPI001C4F4CEE|nr:uncharacterized protein LOC122063348 [Macadamia integrifolia]
MVRPKDKFWEHVEQRGLGHFTCNYCGLNYSGSLSRVKAHLACQPGHDVQICTQVPEHIQADALAEFNLSRSAKKRRSDSLESVMGSTSSIPSMPHVRVAHQPTMLEMAAKQDKKSLDMLQSSDQFDSWKKSEIMQYVSSIKATWDITCCTIMSDSWTDIKKRSWVNVIAYSPGGAVFLKCIECGINRLTSTFLFNEISDVIEKVGPKNVVQFISDNGSNFCSCGDMLSGKWRHIYRTNCAAHGINLLLKDIHKKVKWVREVIEDGKLSLIVVENELRLFVASSEWRAFQFNRAEMAVRTVGIIQSETFWEGAKEVVAFMEPLIRILRLVDSDGSTAGYLYEATERAKETLRKFVEKDGGKYLAIMDLFQFRLEKNIIHYVHLFGALLNPSIMFGGRLDIDGTKFMNAQDFIMDIMVPLEDREQFMQEVIDYRMKSPLLFNMTGQTMMKTNHPRIWWQFFGSAFPVLQNIACRILSQPCSSSPCERNWSAWDTVQTKKRNRLAPEMLEDLVYIRMNSMMRENYESQLHKDSRPIDLDNLGELPIVDFELEMERLEQTYEEPESSDTGADGGSTLCSLMSPH